MQAMFVMDTPTLATVLLIALAIGFSFGMLYMSYLQRKSLEPVKKIATAEKFPFTSLRGGKVVQEQVKRNTLDLSGPMPLGQDPEVSIIPLNPHRRRGGDTIQDEPYAFAHS